MQAAPRPDSAPDPRLPDISIVTGHPLLTEDMYDSVNSYDIPASARLVAGYPDGHYAWSEAEWDRFPDARKYKISNTPPANWQGCSIGDFETGALSYNMASAFAEARDNFRPHTATGYASFDHLPQLRKGFNTPSFQPWVWVALWPNFPDHAEVEMILAALHGWALLAGVQYMNDKTGNYDISRMNRAWMEAGDHDA